MHPTRLDPYVLAVLRENGWSEQRRFPLAESWAREIQDGGQRCFHAAWDCLQSLGGLRIREHSPASARYFLEQSGGDWERLDQNYRRPLERLERLGLNVPLKTYTGASFAFDALDAFRDLETVLPITGAEWAAREALFPIGTLEPDGISCIAPSGKVYTLFDDSFFLSGNSLEDYLNGRFLKELKPKLLYRKDDETSS